MEKDKETEKEKITKIAFINSNDIPQTLEEKITKPIYGLTGIVNSSNTCYMNSAIQAFSHNYYLTSYLFNNEESIKKTLIKNARKILMDNHSFKLETENNNKLANIIQIASSVVPISLRAKIQDPNYQPQMLNEDEEKIVLNNTITFQLIKLLKNMWSHNCVVVPTSFRTIFSEARNKFFFGHDQHDAEEAYSCILQKMQEELAEKKNVNFKHLKPSVKEFLHFKNEIVAAINATSDLEEKRSLLDKYHKKKIDMPEESLTIEAFREMRKYYSNNYSRVSEIFTGFLHSSINCPNTQCGYSSNRFEPFLHLCLSMPADNSRLTSWVQADPFSENFDPSTSDLTIEDCLKEYCREEILDERNLWHCDRCNNKVKGVKKLQLWTAPPVLVIQFKRFGESRSTKDNRLIKYPTEHFDISTVVSKVQLHPEKCTKYRLQCVINHIGGLNSGHYFTYSSDEDSGKWYEFNDKVVLEINKSRIVTRNAYLLFYIREDLINTA